MHRLETLAGDLRFAARHFARRPLAAAAPERAAAVALTVVQRTRDLGIRVALGGSPRGVAAAFFASGMRLTAAALALGLPVSMLALRVALSRVIAPAVSVPAVGVGIALVVLGVAAAATWLPARRASALDPLGALRAD